MTVESKRFLTLKEKKNVQVYEKYRIYGYITPSHHKHPLAEGEVCTIVEIYNRDCGDFGFDFVSERGYVYVAGSRFDVERDSFLMEPVVQ